VSIFFRVVFVPFITPLRAMGWALLLGLFLTLLPQDASAAKRAAPIYPGAVLQCDLAAWSSTRIMAWQAIALTTDPPLFGLSTVAPLYQSLYFRLHSGIDYALVRTSSPNPALVGMAPQCHKVFALEYLMASFPEHDYFVNFDLDAFVSNMHQPLPCLLEHWGVPRKAQRTFARPAPFLWLAIDPDRDHNYQKENGKLNWNTGFMVWRNRRTSRDVIAQWKAGVIKHKLYHRQLFFDQSVLSVSVRPLLDDLNGTHVLTCDEANGWGWLDGGSGAGDCHGKYVTHAWSGKNEALQMMVSRLQSGYWRPVGNGSFHEMTLVL
jgi:hypothetical protein